MPWYGQLTAQLEAVRQVVRELSGGYGRELGTAASLPCVWLLVMKADDDDDGDDDDDDDDDDDVDVIAAIFTALQCPSVIHHLRPGA